MQEPTPHSSRLALAGAVMALLMVGGGGFFIGRTMAPKSEPVVSAVSKPQVSPAPATITPPPTLERAGLLGLIADAAAAVSVSGPQPEAVRLAAGRRFDLVLPFGCEGPTEGERTTPFGWQYDEVKTTLRVWINPIRWDRGVWSSEITEDGNAALEGFWVSMPWSTATGCPSPLPSEAVDAGAVVHTQGEVAIARLIEGDANKSARRLEIVKRMEPGDFDPARGFTLRITGRLESVPARGPVQCVQRTGRQQRPQCLIVGEFAELRIENPATGEVLGVWPMGAADRSQ